MKALFRWIKRGIRRLEDSEGIGLARDVYDIPKQGRTRTPDTQGTHFILYPATGGNILEVRYYDHNTDREEVSLHVITTDQDMGESIGRIITYEALRR
jgi:hypothetical protein